MRDGIIYDCPNANCRTPIYTGKCSKACIEKHNKEMGIKPKTNADRIRAMSDEELADWIARTQMGAIKDAMNLLRLPCDATDGVVELGKTEALEWLQQPAEGE